MKQRKTIQWGILILAGLFLIIAMESITAPPVLPHRFHGTVVDAAGVTMPDGTVVRAMIMDADDGSTQNFTTTVSSGSYDTGDSIVSEGGHNGDMIFFFINDVNTTETGIYEQGGDTTLNLVDDVPISSISTIAPYWHSTTPLSIMGTAVDNAANGLKNVTLWYRYHIDNGSAWGGWISSGLIDSNPWVSVSWLFLFTNGSGHYQFSSIAKDNASNAEALGGTADAYCGYDNVEPSSTVTTIAGYWKHMAPLSITATASDATSGVCNVTLKYRFRATNASGWGGWTSFGVDAAAPWSWSFTFDNDSGHYQFQSIAIDNATNQETIGTPDADCGYDIVAPSSNIVPITGYWKTSGAVLTAVASDTLGGVKNVTLWYSYRVSNSSSWGGWVTFGMDAASPWAWDFTFGNGSGHYRFYSIAKDNATNTESAPAGNDTYCGYDPVAPVSNVNIISSGYWEASSPVSITATASDATSGVHDVTLKYRFRATNASGWDGWTSFGVDAAAPWSWSFTFDNGSGHYQFASIATDNATNQESLSSADAACGYDVAAPSSNVVSISGYWKTSASTLTATSSDALSGVKNVTLWYSYRVSNASAWGGWVVYGVDSASPWSWNFPFSNDSGHYRFYSIAKDNATNTESDPAGNDTYCGYDPIAPSSNVDAIVGYWKTSATTLTATASDDLSGVKNVTLKYSYRASNSSSWGGWVTVSVDAASPWSWDFTFSNGSGHYRFYSIAKDNATNTESVPGGNDTYCGYDNVAPTASMTALSAFKKADFTAAWSATEVTSGVASWTVQYKENSSGVWTAWLTNVSYSVRSATWDIDNTTEGCVVYFRVLAVDNASNCGTWGSSVSTAKDAVAPVVSMTPLSAYEFTNFSVQWSATEATSGVASWTVQYKENSSGTWTAWHTNISYTIRTATWYIANTTVNSTVYFRALAVDNASNCGTWSSSINTTQDTPPNTPSSPSPINGTTYPQGNRPSALSWTGGDVNNDPVNYTIYVRAGNSTFNASFIHGYTENVTSFSMTFAWSTTFYWKIVATDEHGAITAGPIWHFTTVAQGGGGGGVGGGGLADFSIPVSKPGGPYNGVVDTPVQFNGSASYDADTHVVRYDWRFASGDVWHNNSGATPMYTYVAPGTYTVTLRVFDVGGNSGTNATTATITAAPANQPPTVPTITGPTTGKKNTPTSFSIVSTDQNGDTIRYNVSWGDGATNTSTPFASGTTYTVSHAWTKNNVYTINVFAMDQNNASSDMTHVTIAINVTSVQGYGYVMDTDGDGILDTFYSNSTGLSTTMEKRTDGTYLIDMNGDGAWDHVYDPATNTISEYSPRPVTPPDQINLPWLFLIIMVIAIIIIIIIIALLVWLFKTGRI
jgi:hypothetical protein